MFNVRSVTLFSLVVLFPTSTAWAALAVNATVTPLASSYLYEISIENTGPEDVVLVSLVDAPLGDPLIAPSLMAPVGFLALYDSGLGIVDFLENTDLFAAGTTTSGFSFESQAAPGTYFTSFQAYSAEGELFSGTVNQTVIPGGEVAEPATLATWALFGACVVLARTRLRFRGKLT